MTQILIFLFLFFSCCVCSAETIKLKSGKIAEGNIHEKTADHIKIDAGVGVNSTYYFDDIARIEDVGEGKVKMNEVTLVITPLDRPAEPLPSVSSKDSEPVAMKKILSFKDSLNTFVEKLKKSQIKQTFFQNGQEIAERITDSEGITLNKKGIVPDGIVKEYDDRGKVRSEGSFKNNNPVGPWKTYYSNGNIAQVTNYENGEKEGESKTYHESGKIQWERFFHAGKRVGVAKGYSENGVLLGEEDFTDKNYDVIVKAYKEEGGWVSMYMSDGKSVKIESYDEKGNLIKGNK